MSPRPFGQLASGESVEAYDLVNASGTSATILTYGGIVASLRVPDRHGVLADVVLGFDQLAPYLTGHPYFGAIIGRIAGRVTAGRIHVEGRDYLLALTDGPNHLHGGRVGFDKRVWRAESIRRTDGAASLRLNYRSPDGEEGYPGRIDVTVTYTLTANNALVIDSEATADRPTPLCLAHHSYFNLAGEGTGSVADHLVQINAATYVPTDDTMTLSGRRAPVAGTGNDFTRARRLGEALPQMHRSHGEYYLFGAPIPAIVARVTEPRSGRVLEVSTDEPGVQFYTGVALNGTLTGKSGRKYEQHFGFCFECQGYADATTRPGFGDLLVRPGTPQRRRTTYGFKVE